MIHVPSNCRFDHGVDGIGELVLVDAIQFWRFPRQQKRVHGGI